LKISTILDHIDSRYIALPTFQRGYVWNRNQVRALMDSLYRKHPVGSLLVWVTQSEGAAHKGFTDLPPGVVKLLLDGQQRITSLYGIIRGVPPEYFDGKEEVLKGLFFDLRSEEFSYYGPIRMKDDPYWIDVSKLMQEDIAPFVAELSKLDDWPANNATYINRLNAITQIKQIDLHVEEVTGADKDVDVVVDIFNRVNSGGTKLSKGDLALAKVCADWPEARDRMKDQLIQWEDAGFHFDLDWLLRNVNTVLTGEARFRALHNVRRSQFEDGLKRSIKACNFLLNLVSSRLGLDHDRVLFGRYAFPVMTHYVDRRGGKIHERAEQDKILYWYLHSAMWGRFSGSTESLLNRDLEILEELDGSLDRLISELRFWRGDLSVVPEHFGGWSLGARFYPVLYLLSRVCGARDLCSGLEIKKTSLGKMQQLEVHHIFPKAFLYKHGYDKAEVNAVANFCLLTKDCNLEISDQEPASYLAHYAQMNPEILKSQWIPDDPKLWQPEKYMDFLEARRALLAQTANEFLDDLRHGTVDLLQAAQDVNEEPAAAGINVSVPGSIESEEEWNLLRSCNHWVIEQGLPEGSFEYELADTKTGEPIAILDLAWPSGLQPRLSEPVAVLLGEGQETLKAANSAGYRYFTDIEAFKSYVEAEILAGQEAGQGEAR
jgi:hypothetical protein